ncbi:ADH1 [Candida pseudojiufengensis]|uniref:ADH1 n=1 Tax=Candida pseudojiufengensis TaxID=497109 RepID=UPI0022246E18|nr:ADH1 [Candida pseudojiufengensis]KAI5963645.1 ADH1 [Candida pseudojiufengensis]
MSIEIPKTQKAIVFEGFNGPINLQEIPVPEIQPNEILVNIKYSGICHSDLSTYHAAWGSLTKTKILGHEGAGVVVKLGSNVTGWKIGDYAGVKLIDSTCSQCEHCQQANEVLCPKISLNGISTDGTFQQYVATDAFNAAHLPSSVDLSKVGPILCAGVTAYKGLKTSNAKPNEWVAIVGAGGGLGSLAIQYAKSMGLRVIGIDGGEDKAKSAKNLGADEFIDFTKSEDVAKDVIEITNGGAHACINVSTSEKAIQQSVSYVRPNGTVVLIGLPPNASINVNILMAVLKQVTIKGSYVGTRWDTTEAIDIFARGLINCPITVVGLSEVPNVFKLMEENKIVGRYVVDTSK